MGCGCKKTKPDLPTKPGLVYGEKGLDLVECSANEPYPVVGDFTGYIYPFNVRQKMYVDTRDTIYILNDDFSLVR